MIEWNRKDLVHKSGIYKFTCLINNKVYIGQSISLHRRLLKHLNLKGNLVITKALIKYGVENFILEILEFVSPELLDDHERYWIQYYNSYKRKFGYNIKPDGKTSKGAKLSTIARKNIGAASKKWRKDNPERAKKANEKVKAYYNSPEGKAFLSEKGKKFIKTQKGIEFIERTQKRMAALKGTVHITSAMPVKRINLNSGKEIGKYPSIKEASRQTEKSEKQIRYALGFGSRGLPPTGEWILITKEEYLNGKI